MNGVKKYLLKVEVEPLAEGGYFAICPDLQGCYAQGDTIADAIENVEDVARIIIELCLEKGLSLPPELKDPETPTIIKAEMVVRVGS